MGHCPHKIQYFAPKVPCVILGMCHPVTGSSLLKVVVEMESLHLVALLFINGFLYLYVEINR